ncbi:MAG: DNA repair protein RadA, partial [Deltaproteobacteria bacterium]|nr:DNA repair protein RadA [Deltaproteobacteria bacterium]
MAKKSKTSFFCTSCDYQSPKWLGKCPACNEWESMREAPPENDADNRHETPQLLAALDELGETAQPRPLNAIADEKQPRKPCDISEFDRVLGG